MRLDGLLTFIKRKMTVITELHYGQVADSRGLEGISGFERPQGNG